MGVQLMNEDKSTKGDKHIHAEIFKPVSVKSPSVNPLFFWLRCIMDLQLRTIVLFLQPALHRVKGNILDIGAGESPWYEWLPEKTFYVGLDVYSADKFGMTAARKDLIYYDGKIVPFDASSFDVVLCVEVLEHVEEPVDFIEEIVRVLKSNGRLILTTPFSARRHHTPNDFQRYTREGLHYLLVKCGFEEIVIIERGNDLCVIANKLLVVMLGLVKPQCFWQVIYKWPIALFLLPALFISFLVAHLSLFFNFGSNEDPLGYYVEAKRP
jgi:SAM-dependent methyltransferase